MSGHVESKKNYFIVFAALITLTFLTVGAAYIDFGFLNNAVALAIASVKALLVILIFMHVRYSEMLTKLFLACGFIWLLVLFGLTMSDYASRDWDAIYTQESWSIEASKSAFNPVQLDNHNYSSAH